MNKLVASLLVVISCLLTYIATGTSPSATSTFLVSTESDLRWEYFKGAFTEGFEFGRPVSGDYYAPAGAVSYGPGRETGLIVVSHEGFDPWPIEDHSSRSKFTECYQFLQEESGRKGWHLFQIDQGKIDATNQRSTIHNWRRAYRP